LRLNPFFLYFDTKAIEQEENDRRKKYEEEFKKRQEIEAANPTPEPSPENIETEMTTPPSEELRSSPPDSEPTPDLQPPPAVVAETEIRSDNNETLSTYPKPDDDTIPLPYSYGLEEAFFWRRR